MMFDLFEPLDLRSIEEIPEAQWVPAARETLRSMKFSEEAIESLLERREVMTLYYLETSREELEVLLHATPEAAQPNAPPILADHSVLMWVSNPLE